MKNFQFLTTKASKSLNEHRDSNRNAIVWFNSVPRIVKWRNTQYSPLMSDSLRLSFSLEERNEDMVSRSPDPMQDSCTFSCSEIGACGSSSNFRPSIVICDQKFLGPYLQKLLSLRESLWIFLKLRSQNTAWWGFFRYEKSRFIAFNKYARIFNLWEWRIDLLYHFNSQAEIGSQLRVYFVIWKIRAGRGKSLG